MAVLSVHAALSATTPSGVVRPEDFVLPLQAEPSDLVVRVSPGGPRWIAGVVEFATVSLDEFADQEEPSAAFFVAVSEYLDEVAQWISRRTVALRELVDRGVNTRLSVTIEMTVDQFEIILPPQLTLAAGQALLPVEVHSY